VASPALARLTVERTRFTDSQQAEATRRAYARDWRFFSTWCAEMKYSSLPASSESVVLYITHALRKKKITTARRYISAINDAHRTAGYPRPADDPLRQLIEGAERMRCERPNQKRPLTVDELRRACRIAEGPGGIRDCAILTLGFASALRRSNLAALDVADISVVAQGLLVQVQREKQDQKGKGRVIGILRGAHPDTCPIAAMEAWLRIRGADAGPLFTRIVAGKVTLTRLYNDKVSRIVKSAVKRLGLDPAHYGGHSLRAGFVTAAFEAGAGEILIAAQTGHRSLSSLRRYFRRTDPFRANPSGMIGL
jgi:integrase